MRDILFKLKQLYYFLLSAFELWKSDIWDRDLDEPYCCDGRECCCEGLSLRLLYGDVRDHGAQQETRQQ